MKIPHQFLAITFLALTSYSHAGDPQLLVYVNEHLGFNVEGYKYSQNEFPCDIDTQLIQDLIIDAKNSKVKLEAVGTADKIRNGKVPVLAMDIEELVLNEDYQFGNSGKHTLPKIGVTAAVIIGDKIETAKHTCAIATLNEFTPTSDVLDLGTAVTVCGATKRCLKDLSKDIVEWMVPQVK